MSPDHQRVWALVKRCTSPQEAISREDLVRLMGIDDRAVRRLVRELVVEHGITGIIASSEGGYWYAERQRDRVPYVSSEMRRAFSILERARLTAGPRAFAEAAGQLRLLARAADMVGTVADESTGEQDTSVEPKAPGAVHGSTGPRGDDLVRGEDGKPKRCLICNGFLRGRQERFCSDYHKDLYHGRRRAS